MYTVRFKPAAARWLARADPAVARRLMAKLKWLSQNLDMVSTEPLTGEFAGVDKLRVGQWRVLYTCDAVAQVLTVHLVGHRREIYK